MDLNRDSGLTDNWRVIRLALVATVLLVASGCAGGSGGDEAALDWRYSTLELIDITYADPANSVIEGLDALPGPSAYDDGRTPSHASGDRFGSFTVLSDSSSSYVVRYAAGATRRFTETSDDVGDRDAGTLGREGLAFADGDRVAAQWLTDTGVLMTAVMELEGSLPMTDPDLAAALSSLDEFMHGASSVDYVLTYERLWEATTLENRGTGAVTTGDQREQWTATVSSDLVASGTFATSTWSLTANGQGNRALSHVERRWTPGAEFLRAACSGAELAANGWIQYGWDADSFANLGSPGYVPALFERLVEPRLLDRDEGGATVGFSLRRGGLLGEPWPLWSYGDDWDIAVTVETGPAGELLRLRVESSRGPNATSGPGSDVVAIEITSWDEPVDVAAPIDVVDEAPWPPACPEPI